MKSLIVEDDFTSRTILQRYLLSYGEAEVAPDGPTGLKAVQKAAENGKPFDLVCLDIMLPEMDGQTVLKEIRAFEESKGVTAGKGTRVIMTTALGDKKNVMEAIQNCDAYLVKPIDRNDLMFYLKRFGLIE